MSNCVESIKQIRLQDLLDGGRAFDSLAEAICGLKMASDKACTLGEFMDFGRSLGLDLSGLEGALLDSAELMSDQAFFKL